MRGGAVRSRWQNGAMPEGDTIFRAARALHTALAGRTVTHFETVVPRLARVDDETPLKGRTVERVTAAGKHLIIHFSGDLTLRTHLRMSGSWRVYHTGEPWGKRRGDMRLLIATEEFVAVGFNIPVAEFRSERDLARQPELQRLGPDPLGPDFDSAEAVRRLRAQGAVEIAPALLNQRVLAGIGNIYKSEVLFACGVNPFTLVDSLSDGDLERIVRRGGALLRQGVAGRARHLVYGRGREPCRKCGTEIEWRRQGPDARGTYWCPRCQK
jgi:endonuclease-8